VTILAWNKFLLKRQELGVLIPSLGLALEAEVTVRVMKLG
jgi:hypothetical protein